MLDEKVPSLENKDYYTVMAHFYRGELGRIMIWRQRLDVTTNWAIVSVTGITTFALGNSNSSHFVFFIAVLFCYLLLNIEARRYRYYDAFRARVRMLEAHLLMPVVMKDAKLLQGDWFRLLGEDLVLPSFKVSRWDAIVRRFRRNYVWIILLIYAGWVAKLWISTPKTHSLADLYKVFVEQQPLPPLVLWGLFVVQLILFVVLTVSSLSQKQSSGEFGVRPMRRKKWTI